MRIFKTPKGTELPLMLLQGKEYLQVSHRLLWFRETHPTWSIDPLPTFHENILVVQATIRDQNGNVVAKAHKAEGDWKKKNKFESCETGAIGRALAMCGFGTQFCSDELDEGEDLADAPIANKNAPPSITMEQPGDGDGYSDDVYRVPCGKWAKRTLDNIYRTFGPKEMGDYVITTEEKLEIGKIPFDNIDDMKDFCTRASKFLGEMENTK